MRQKKNWMPYLTFGISLLFLFSCGKTTLIDYLYKVEHFYINQSGEDLTMKVYNKHDEMFKSFIIKNGDSINTHTSITDGPGILYFADNTHEVGDSVVVKFITNKCLSYHRGLRNGLFDIKEYDNYSDDLIDPGGFTLYYTFTEEDYNLAVDCN